MAFDVYQTVTDKIIAKLEEGVVPWQRPWKVNQEPPANLISKKPYKGINVILLSMEGLSSPWWMTFKQAAELGYRSWLKDNNLRDSQDNAKTYQKLAVCQPGEDFDPATHKRGVKKGERSTLITFWKLMKGKDPDSGEPKTFPLMRHYNVFNLEQTHGLNVAVAEEVEEGEPITTVESCEAIVENMPSDMPRPEHRGQRAYFMPSTDQVVLPAMEKFKSCEGYYSTLFHELVHATGHKTRLNRPEIQKGEFGSDPYSREELVAEMGAAMLCAVSGIEPQWDNSAAYLKSWLKKLQDDKKLIVQAAGKAQKAADYILNITDKTTEDVAGDKTPVTA